MATAHIDWDALELEYIRAKPRIGCKRIANEHGYAVSTVAQYARAHEWVRKRDEYWDRVQAKARALVEQEDVDWTVAEAERVDGVLDILYEGIHSLTARAKLGDIETLTKLKLLLLGQPDSRQEITGSMEVEHSGELDIDIPDDSVANVLHILAEAGAFDPGAEADGEAADE